MLSQKEKELISKKIEECESKSSAELVAVISKRSSNYEYSSLLISLIFTFIVSLICIIFIDITNIFLLQIQILCIVGLKIVFDKFDRLTIYFLPKSYKKEVASEYANKQFYNLGLNRTKTNQAIMFFVSLDEKYVEIISDKTISEKIEDKFWQDIVDEFIINVKANRLSQGYLQAINQCSLELIDKFPIQKNDINELSNEVIELK